MIEAPKMKLKDDWFASFCSLLQYKVRKHIRLAHPEDFETLEGEAVSGAEYFWASFLKEGDEYVFRGVNEAIGSKH